MTMLIPACIVAIMAFDGQAEETVEEIDAWPSLIAPRSLQTLRLAIQLRMAHHPRNPMPKIARLLPGRDDNPVMACPEPSIWRQPLANRVCCYIY
ncbi:hypothetical protein [Mesorhizobium sp. BR1-1-2]|uniref:hypothetical protein n=1 Tax=Mesorhizobium sp. BR1-1-2 TaxID=2876652 RepID=UPI001CCCB0C9|nr:hypothetical protein [Mesorhizobium sp. BR1-1-2]MBZ9963319.1 hypothetical protein [Mesorhizobium sp. BR1-1-2]